MSKRIKISAIKELYNKAKAAKVGEKVCCPSCRTEFEKTNYQQAFCKSKGGTVCKDYYWNYVDPSKRNNTTRISPANAAFYTRYIEPLTERREREDFDDDPSWDAHKDTM